MDKKEQAVMAMYDATRPGEFSGVPSNVNHLAWSLLAVAVGLIAWLLIALSNAENQRNALMTKVCQDRVFAAEIDTRCLERVKTRDHWWQHVSYALTHPRA